MKLIGALGLDWRTLIFQLINFGIIFFVLAKFAFPALQKMLDARQKEIEDGLKNAELASKNLANIQNKEDKILGEARNKASEIVTDARHQAKLEQTKILNENKRQLDQQLIENEKKLAQMKEKILLETKAELVEVVTTGVNKVLQSDGLNEEKENYTRRMAKKVLS